MTNLPYSFSAIRMTIGLGRQESSMSGLGDDHDRRGSGVLNV
jgi:hypothetical protein